MTEPDRINPLSPQDPATGRLIAAGLVDSTRHALTDGIDRADPAYRQAFVHARLATTAVLVALADRARTGGPLPAADLASLAEQACHVTDLTDELSRAGSSAADAPHSGPHEHLPRAPGAHLSPAGRRLLDLDELLGWLRGHRFSGTPASVEGRRRFRDHLIAALDGDFGGEAP